MRSLCIGIFIRRAWVDSLTHDSMDDKAHISFLGEPSTWVKEIVKIGLASGMRLTFPQKRRFRTWLASRVRNLFRNSARIPAETAGR